VSNFIINRYWTFPESRSKSAAGQLAQYSIVSVIGLIIRTSIFVLIKQPLINLAGFFDLPFSLRAEVVGENITLAIVVIIVMFWNFFANRYWTFGDID
jgi:putative flippase GtrA